MTSTDIRCRQRRAPEESTAATTDAESEISDEEIERDPIDWSDEDKDSDDASEGNADTDNAKKDELEDSDDQSEEDADIDKQSDHSGEDVEKLQYEHAFNEQPSEQGHGEGDVAPPHENTDDARAMLQSTTQPSAKRAGHGFVHLKPSEATGKGNKRSQETKHYHTFGENQQPIKKQSAAHNKFRKRANESSD